MKPRRRSTEPGALAMIEEAVQLLRSAPPAAWAVYYAGAVPFVLAGLFFWARTTWYQPSGAAVAWGALGLTVLFVLLKALQAEFCRQLLALRLGLPPAAWSWRRLGCVAVAQLHLQPWALLADAVAAIVVFPFGWVYAYGQIASVIGDDDHLHANAVTQAQLWPEQNHVALALLSALTFCVWINFAGAFVAAPWLANRLLGIDNLFGFSGWAFLNTTFLASVTGLTWLAIDPVVKAFYTVWVFHGRARRTGEDVRVEFQLAPRPTGSAARVALIGLALWAAAAAPRLRASEPVVAGPVQAQPLDRALDRALAGSDFAWRLRPLPAAPSDRPEGTVERFLREGAEIVGLMARAVAHWVHDVIAWLDRHLGMRRGEGGLAAAGLAVGALRLVLYVLVGVAILLLLWLVWLVARNVRRSAVAGTATAVIPRATPDLRDEKVQAADLPTDGWLALAREQAACGEWRLAWRALYLATLARLAADGLVSLARFKTNLDYEREVRRRALSRVELVSRFSARRRSFEDVWYGRTIPGETEVRAWMTELERPGAG